MHESDSNCRRGGDQPERKKHTVQQRRAAAFIRCVVKQPVPLIDAELDAQRHHNEKRRPRRPGF
jgi:hypothetical protein